MTKKPNNPKQKLILPQKIPDSHKNIVKAILNTPPKKPDEWRYMQKRKG